MTIAVLFDFNGVLVDDEDVHFEAFRRTLAVLGVTISHEVYRRFLGYDDRGTIVALLAHYDRAPTSTTARSRALVADKQDGYARLAGQHPRLGFGARALVRALRGAGARLAIVSGARRAEIDAVLDASRCATASTPSSRPRTSRAASPIPKAIGWRWRGSRRRRDAARRGRDRGCARRLARGARRRDPLHRPRHDLSGRRARRRRRHRLVAGGARRRRG